MRATFKRINIQFFTLLFLTAAGIYGQSDQARISGTVTDASGGAIVGATVTAKNERTGKERTAIADKDGSFIIAALEPATYTLTVTSGDFQPINQTGVELLVGQPLDLHLTLQPKGVAAQVDIMANDDAIANISSASMSANVSGREVEALPINGRQLSQLYLQAPGAVNTGTGTFGDIRFNGRANQQNVIRYDGVEGTAIVDASPGNINGEVPSPFRLQSSLENVQEFRVESSNFPAEFGTGTGGQISVVTKSGGNQFHGSAFEYLRRDALDARNFFDGGTKSPLSLDQFGGSVGGPIIKDKLFFFGSYERYRGRFGLNFIEAAPQLSLANPGATFNGTPVNAGVQPYIAAFRSASAVTLGPSTTPGFDIVQLQANEKTDEASYAARFDWQYNQMNKVYFRFFRDQGRDDTPEGVSGRVTAIVANPQNAVLGWQSIMNKTGTLINEFKIGYNGAFTRINGSAPTVNGIDLTPLSLNISGNVALAGIAGQAGNTGVSVPGGLVRANSATNGRGQPYTPYSLGFIDNLTWTHGDHNIKFGGEYRMVRLYTDRQGGTTYTFSSLANFLTNNISSVQYLGDVSAPSPFTSGPGGSRLAKQAYYIAYGQDEWKVRPGLTVNFGLRYEYYSPLKEANDQQIYFDIVSGTLRPVTEDPYITKKNNFGPRVALTWSPDPTGVGFFAGGRTILRGGIGLFYGPGQTEDQIQPIESDRISSTISGSTIFNGTQLLAFPAPIASIIANFNANPNNRNYQPRAYSRTYSVPERVTQYTVSWQQELPGKLVSTVAYVGSKGHNLFLRSVANQILPGSTTITNGSNIPTGFGVVNRTDPISGQVVGVNTIRQFSIVSGTSVQNPYAEVDYKTSGGRDTYNALQISLQRQFRTGLTMNAQYTFGNSVGTSAGSNEARTSAQLDNFEADYGRNNFDVHHTFNMSALYMLPFGKGKGHDLGSVGNAILGDWEIGGIFNARSGVPIEVNIVRPDVVIQCALAAGCPNGTGTPFVNGFTAQLPTIGASFPALPTGFVAVVNTPGGGNSRNIRRPDLIAGANPFLNADRQFLNPAAFATPAAGAFGNLARNAFSGPTLAQFDMTFIRRFHITESANFEFRTEIFNILNHANFTNPAATLALALPTLTCVTPGAGTCASYNTTGTNLQPGSAYTQSAAGSTFGLLRATVGRTVGLGSNRQIQFGFRFNF